MADHYSRKLLVLIEVYQAELPRDGPPSPKYILRVSELRAKPKIHAAGRGSQTCVEPVDLL